MSIKYLCACVFFTVFLSLVPSYGDTNILENPGFEGGTTGIFIKKNKNLKKYLDVLKCGW